MDYQAQDVSKDSWVRQGDSKALMLGLWDLCCLPRYISLGASPAEYRH